MYILRKKRRKYSKYILVQIEWIHICFPALSLVIQYDMSKLKARLIPKYSITWENFDFFFFPFLLMCSSFVVLIAKTISHLCLCSAAGLSSLLNFHVVLTLIDLLCKKWLPLITAMLCNWKAPNYFTWGKCLFKKFRVAACQPRATP